MKKNRQTVAVFGVWFGLVLVLSFAAQGCVGADDPEADNGSLSQKALCKITLEEALRTALANNRQRPASRFALAMAEAKHRQAMAGYWPHVSLTASYIHMDERPTFLYPPDTIHTPAQTMRFPGGSFMTPRMSVTIPANAFAPGVPARDLALDVPQSRVSVPGQTINVPAQHYELPPRRIETMDEESVMGSIQVKWLLFDGFKREAQRSMARHGADVAREVVRRTDLEVTTTVQRMYYGSVLARILHEVGKDTLVRMEATLQMTEALYKEGSGTVKKTDYLDNRVMVESLRAMVALLEKNEKMACSALAYSMGLSWDANLQPADEELPHNAEDLRLESLIGKAYRFNPDWRKIEAGLRAAQAGIAKSRSGHYPTVALTGSVNRWWNDYEYGLSTEENEESWNVGVHVSMPLFEGRLTANRVREAKAALDKLKSEKFLLRDAIALQIKDVFLSLDAAQKQYAATLTAMNTSTENRKLNIRAYQHSLAETEDVIQAQLMEAFMQARHYKVLYDHLAMRAELDRVVGTEISRQVNEKMENAF